MESKEKYTKLSRRDLLSLFWRGNFLQASFNYERFQNIGWAFTMIPILKKVYPDKDELSAALGRHLEFFNTHPYLISPLAGIIAAMEEEGEDQETVRGVKVALMGPLGGIGDALIWLTFLPIFAGLGAALAMEGNLAGPILYLVLMNVLNFSLKYFGVFFGYNAGITMLSAIGEKTQALSKAASTIGILVIGSLIATYVKINVPITITAGQAEIHLQTGFLDKIMPGLLPLLITLGLLYLMQKRNISVVTAIIIILVFSILGSYLHFLS